MAILNSENRVKILDIIESYMPETWDTKMKLQWRNGINKDAETFRDLVGNLYSGLKYGNWPWIKI